MPEYTGTYIIFADNLLENGFLSSNPSISIEEFKIYESDKKKAYINAYRKGKEKSRNLLGIVLNPRLEVIIDDV